MPRARATLMDHTVLVLAETCWLSPAHTSDVMPCARQALQLSGRHATSAAVSINPSINQSINHSTNQPVTSILLLYLFRK